MSDAPVLRQVHGPALAGTCLMVSVLGAAFWVHTLDPELFYLSVREDEYLEWGTFWAFLLAAAAHGAGALRQRSAGDGLPWFSLGLGLFCFIVAMEEISWGQRILGYRPPAYFLEHNFQQEPNLHNIIDSRLRKDAFVGLIAAYGVALPLLARIPRLRRLSESIGITAPSAWFAPGFAIAIWTYVDYPWRFTGEVVEFSVSLGFLSAACLNLRTGSGDGTRRRPRATAQVVFAALLSLGLGAGSAALSRHQRSASPEAIQSAHFELEALKRDFHAFETDPDGHFDLRCGLHKRLYTYVESYGADFLYEGEFAALTEQGLPKDRADFFIDPWNGPYWIRSRCAEDYREQSVFIYSFGPNRVRDSSKWEFLHDDPGIYLLQLGTEAD